MHHIFSIHCQYSYQNSYKDYLTVFSSSSNSIVVVQPIRHRASRARYELNIFPNRPNRYYLLTRAIILLGLLRVIQLIKYFKGGMWAFGGGIGPIYMAEGGTRRGNLTSYRTLPPFSSLLFPCICKPSEMKKPACSWLYPPVESSISECILKRQWITTTSSHYKQYAPLAF